MSTVIKLDQIQIPHREAESIKEKVKHIESLVILCEESIRLHAVPEMQNVGEVLFSLIEPLHEMGRSAKALEGLLYQDFLNNKGQSSLNCKISGVG